MDANEVDGISLILGALTAGAADGLKESAKVTISAARDRLIRGLRSAFSRTADERGDAQLTKFLANPTSDHAESLRPHLAASQVDTDATILSLARELAGTGSTTAIGPGAVSSANISVTTGGGAAHIGGIQNYGGTPLPPT